MCLLKNEFQNQIRKAICGSLAAANLGLLRQDCDKYPLLLQGSLYAVAHKDKNLLACHLSFWGLCLGCPLLDLQFETARATFHCDQAQQRAELLLMLRSNTSDRDKIQVISVYPGPFAIELQRTLQGA